MCDTAATQTQDYDSSTLVLREYFQMECTSHRCLPHAFLILLHRSSVSADVPGFRLLGEYSQPQFRLVPEQRQVCKFAVGAKEHKHSVEMTQPPRSAWLRMQLCNSYGVIFFSLREKSRPVATCCLVTSHTLRS